ncbi:putative transmembrane protein [Gregarina niphandrodes]|uniref:Transmembrane protein n=1 Tax=Gregarina niphandrodes TaxID=110365 RepID=A0A023B5Q3_GRENI|nr:putative transmembrane protein [Gregarina niphandrodes]EZG61411.1 putative transmembrane protein [Gregarina niphandrodes]|eukprot:XP_011130771.1 putative transmembrane protein [Gregarina niphandrodes]
MHLNPNEENEAGMRSAPVAGRDANAGEEVDNRVGPSESETEHAVLVHPDSRSSSERRSNALASSSSVATTLRRQTSLVELPSAWTLRLLFVLWLMCVKGVCAVMTTWPILLHSDSILNPPSWLDVDASWRGMWSDPFSWLCFVVVGISWTAGSIGLAGLFAKSPPMVTAARLTWAVAVLLIWTVALTVYVLKRTYRLPTNKHSEINPAILQTRHQTLFVLLLIGQLFLSVIGSLFVGALARLELIFKTEELLKHKQHARSLSAEEVDRLLSA